jgi:hypothetical protein
VFSLSPITSVKTRASRTKRSSRFPTLAAAADFDCVQTRRALRTDGSLNRNAGCETEHGRVDADAEGKRNDGRESEPAIAVQRPRRIAKIAREVFEPVRAPCFARLLCDMRGRAEFPPRRGEGIFAGYTLFHQFAGPHFEMCADLVIERGVKISAATQVSQLAS